jgi:hypothetical protein
MIEETVKRAIICLVIGFFLMNVGIFGSLLGEGIYSHTSNTQEPVNTSRSNLIISKDTTWNKHHNLTGNVLVENGATLTIDPGVVVRLGKDNYIQVEGKLVAEGTVNKMITFTSIKINPSESDYWDSIKFMNDANNGSSIKYCNITYAKYAIYVDPQNPTWAPYQNAPNITHSHFGNCKNSIYFDSRYPNISFSNYTNVIESNIIKNGLDIFIENSNVSFKNNVVFGGISGILMGGCLEIINNSISGAEIGILCTNSWISDLIITKNLITGNSDSGIAIGNWANDGIDSINIINNTIIHNKKGIDFIGTPNKINISNNVIKNNKHGILFPSGYLYFPSAPNYYHMNHNNINNNSIYNVKNGVPKTWGDWDFKNNWWGTTNANEINQSIYDYYDDFNLGKVIYKPYLTSEVNIFKPYNLPPVADAGPNRSAVKGEPVTFDGSGSTDPNNIIVSGIWDFGDGKTSNYIGNETYNEYQISHTYEKTGNYTVTLTVFDGLLYDNDTCWVNVTKKIVINQAPFFSGLSDKIELYEDSYLYTIDLLDHIFDDRTPKNQLNISIINNTNPNCGVTLDSNRYIIIKPKVNWYGNSTITLQIDDGELNSTFNLRIVVFPVREPPMADAGGDQYAKINTTVTFDGSGSIDVDEDFLTYNWSFGDSTYTGWQNSSNTSHLYNKTGRYKVILRVSDGEFTASDTIFTWIYLNETSKPPVISNLPDIYIHYYDLSNNDDYFGYGYDFSYFINDPDNSVSELTIKGVPFDRLIFKFPFETADLYKQPVYLYVKDLNPRTFEIYRVFNITVVIDLWPVELVKPFDELKLYEDFSVADDVFNLENHFYDRDATTTYEVLNKNNGKVRGEIDSTNNLDLFSNNRNFTGTEEVVIHAHDSLPEQDVYAVVKIKINPVNDPPIIHDISNLVIKENELRIIDLEDYITDIDTEFSKLFIESSEPEHAWINGSELYIQYGNKGEYLVTITVSDGEFTVTHALEITIKEDDGSKPTSIIDKDDDNIPDYWEIEWGFDPNNASDANLDLDNDSLSNLEEYRRDTNPVDHDTDGDGYSDKVDEFPNDPGKYISETEKEKIDQIGYYLVLFLIFIIILILLFSMFILKNKRKSEMKFTPDDEIYSKVMHDILFDYQPNSTKLSNDELKAILDEKLKNGQISAETYNYMVNLTQETKNSQENNI